MIEDDAVRALVLELGSPADWKVLSAVWYGVQSELELPAPAIAVSGTDSLQLWFSLSEAVNLALARRFLSGLQHKFLHAVAPKRLHMYPPGDGPEHVTYQHTTLVPARQESTGYWSAFVSPDLAAVFGEEPWLDLAPNPDQQADILSKLRTTQPEQLRAALDRLKPQHDVDALSPPKSTKHLPASSEVDVEPGVRAVTPREFLMGVMNDPAYPLHDRIEAAKALLPYSEATGRILQEP